MFGRKGKKSSKKQTASWGWGKNEPEPEPQQPAMDSHQDAAESQPAATGDDRNFGQQVEGFGNQVQGFGYDAFGATKGFAQDTWDQMSGNQPQGSVEFGVQDGQVTMETSGGIVQEGEGQGQVEEVKTEEKVDEVKTEEKVDEVKTEEKVDEVKTEEKVDEVKTEEKVDEVKTEEKMDEVKIEEKVDEVKIEEKVDEVKTEEKEDEVKAEEKVEEVKVEEAQEGDTQATAPEEVKAEESQEPVQEATPSEGQVQVEVTTEVQGEAVVSEEVTNVEVTAGDQPADQSEGAPVGVTVDLQFGVHGGEVTSDVTVSGDGVDVVLQPAEGDQEVQAEVAVEAQEEPVVEAPPQEEAPKAKWPKQPLPELVMTEHSEREKEKLGVLEVKGRGTGESAEATEAKNCSKCSGEIAAGEVAISAPKVTAESCWHPACFVCATCDELLVDLVYCHHEGNIYCERHFAEKIKPRCAACDECQSDQTEAPRGRYRRGSVSHSWKEATYRKSQDIDDDDELIRVKQEQQKLSTPSHEFYSSVYNRPQQEETDKNWLIFSGEYTKAMDQDWHSGHFCCFNCDLNLTGYRYILRDEHPYCIKCYENLFANSCEECKTPIGTDSKDLSYKEKHWHEKCFKCTDCQRSLVDQPFASKNEKLYCADCHDNNFAARCDGCSNIFRAGMKKYEYKGKQWHEQCFCCKVCQQPIGNKSFIPRDQEVVCVNCYEEQYAQRCMKCNGVINKGGITYKGTPWHRDCFTCTNCSKVLAGDKFTSREDKPYCADCFGQLFAKKCCKCTNPITGLGGTKFISFEERHWHSDCFLCYKCNVSLVGRGFLTDTTDILCPDCGRA